MEVDSGITASQKQKLEKILLHVSSEQLIDYPNHKDEVAESNNIQLALKDFGFEVMLCNAAYLWEAYSQSLQAGWISGPDSKQDAKFSILNFLDDLYIDIFGEE